MMLKARSLFLLTLLTLPGAILADPTPIRANFMQGVWIVRGTIGDRSAYFMVDTGANRTGLLPDPDLRAGDFPIDLKIGEFSSHTLAYVAPLELLTWIKSAAAEIDPGAKPIIGVLGMDVLDKVAVGFDYLTQEITFWPKGKLDEGMCLGWVEQKFGAQKPVRLDISKRLGERVGIPLTIGGKTCWAVLDSGAAESALRPAFGKKVGAVLGKSQLVNVAVVNVESRIIPEATLGEIGTPWFYYTLSKTVEGLPGKPDAIVAMNDLRSRRVLIDLAGNAAYYAPPTPEKSREMALGKLLQCPVQLDGDTLRVGAWQPGFYEPVKQFELCKILWIADRPVRDVAAALVGKTPKDEKFIIELAKRVQNDFQILVLYQGQATTFNIRTFNGPTGGKHVHRLKNPCTLWTNA